MIKKVDARSRVQKEGLIRELAVLRTINQAYPDGHPCLLRLWAAYQHKACGYMVTEYCQGGDLRGRLYHPVDDDYPELASLGAAVCLLAGLRALHAMNLNWRDGKPGNVFCTLQRPCQGVELLKLADFDKSVAVPQPESSEGATPAHQVSSPDTHALTPIRTL